MIRQNPACSDLSHPGRLRLIGDDKNIVFVGNSANPVNGFIDHQIISAEI
jgi:hypothetical protein